MGLGLAVGTAWAAQGTAQVGTVQDTGDMIHKAEQSMVLILGGNGGGRVLSVSTGVIVRSDGIVLTAYRPLKGAQEVQVRMWNGEVYDQVELMGFDERRDVAALHIPASGLAALSGAALEEAAPGDRIHVLDVNGMLAWSSSDGVLGPVRLADEFLGAGHGFRVIQFMASLPPGALGGALVSSRQQLLGIITGSPNTGRAQFAVPLASVAGLEAQGLRTALGNGKNLALPAAIPNPGPAAEAPSSPLAALAIAQTLRVTSKTSFFTPFMLEKELLDDSEFRALGLSVVNDNQGGELLVNIDRPLFTYDFTYAVSDSHSGIVLATGKVTAIDGPHAAQGIAKKLVQELEKARAVNAALANRQEALSSEQPQSF
jgi:hypothetical protein